MNHHTKFIQAYDYCRANNLYLGTGNPDAKILIIGKECAHESPEMIITPELLKQWEQELVVENLTGWNTYLNSENATQHQNNDSFNVRFPYSGQKNILNRVVGVDIENNQKTFNGGTSDTWLKYQRLCDNIFNEGKKSNTINFHDKIFITELNQIPTAYSTDQNIQLRKESVAKRADMFMECPFFRSFPVTILACGHYPKMMGINLETIFSVQWNGKTNGDKQQFYNIHHGDNNTRILIHTRQLSMAVTNDLIAKIAQCVKGYI